MQINKILLIFIDNGKVVNEEDQKSKTESKKSWIKRCPSYKETKKDKNFEEIFSKF